MKSNFENLIGKEKSQVFLFSCPAAIPVNFARHTWLVTNNKGELFRYEVLHKKNDAGYLYKDLFPPFQGTWMFFFNVNLFWRAKLVGSVEGETAKKIIDSIESLNGGYPYRNIYKFLGPNSNTYTAWILKKFPEWKIKLPWNAIGKNYASEQIL